MPSFSWTPSPPLRQPRGLRLPAATAAWRPSRWSAARRAHRPPPGQAGEQRATQRGKVAGRGLALKGIALCPPHLPQAVGIGGDLADGQPRDVAGLPGKTEADEADADEQRGHHHHRQHKLCRAAQPAAAADGVHRRGLRVHTGQLATPRRSGAGKHGRAGSGRGSGRLVRRRDCRRCRCCGGARRSGGDSNRRGSRRRLLRLRRRLGRVGRLAGRVRRARH